MKLLNIFKKETSKRVKNNIQKMDKTQLEKVIGGVDTNGVTLHAPVAMDKGLK